LADLLAEAIEQLAFRSSQPDRLSQMWRESQSAGLTDHLLQALQQLRICLLMGIGLIKAVQAVNVFDDFVFELGGFQRQGLKRRKVFRPASVSREGLADSLPGVGAPEPSVANLKALSDLSLAHFCFEGRDLGLNSYGFVRAGGADHCVL